MHKTTALIIIIIDTTVYPIALLTLSFVSFLACLRPLPGLSVRVVCALFALSLVGQLLILSVSVVIPILKPFSGPVFSTSIPAVHTHTHTTESYLINKPNHRMKSIGPVL